MKLIRVAAAAALMAACGLAQTHQVTGPTVRAAGEAVVYAKPDEAKIDIGVFTQAPTAQLAASQNAAKLQAALDRLRGMLGPKSDIRTISYSVNPNYEFGGGGRKLNGYNAVNTVRVTTDDLAGLGKLIDAATAAGANEVQRIEFTLKDETPVRAEALRKATVEARANAEAMAGALGLKLGRLVSLEQGSPQTIRPMAMAAETARVAAAPTPIEAGVIEVHASVTLVMAVE
jgi:uncharacterized protein YggE